MGAATAGQAGSAVTGWSAWQGVLGGDERVGAELGQDVAGLPEDLADLGEGDALAALAVLDRGVVAVIRRSLPRQPARGSAYLADISVPSLVDQRMELSSGPEIAVAQMIGPAPARPGLALSRP